MFESLRLKTSAQKVSLFLLSAAICSISFSMALNSIFTWGFIIFSLTQIKWTYKIGKKTGYSILIGIFFIISILFVRDITVNQLKFLTRVLPLLLVPIIFANYKNFLSVNELTILLTLSSLISISIGIVTAIEFYTRPEQHFSLIHLPHTLNGKYHSVYFSIQLGINIVLLFFGSLKWNKVYKPLLCLLFFMIMVVLGKRMPLIALFVVLAIHTIKYFDRRKVAFLLVFSFLSCFIYFLSPYNQWRWSRFESDGEGSERMIMMRAATAQIKESMFFGVGTANVNGSLGTYYQERGLSQTFFANNPHNQFLYIGMASGFIGLIFYVVSQAFLLRNAFEQRNHLFLLGFCFFFAVAQTECILIRQQGILLYATIIACLFYEKET